jgi:nucleotide-binding universal stress UspA family protein
MYDEILLPTDGSAHATAAAEHALALARAFDATVHVLGVADVNRAAGLFDAGGVDEAFLERVEREAEDAVERTAGLAGTDDRVETAVVDGDPGDAIIEYAEDEPVDAVVMGTHGRRGLRRFIAGSVTEHVVRLSPVPVFTVRRPDDADDAADESAEAGEAPADATGPLPSYETVLVPTDGSDTAELAVDHAVGIADAFDGRLHALSVVDVGALGAESQVVPTETMIESLTQRSEAAVAAVAERAGAAGLDITTEVQQGFPGTSVLRYAREHDADVVVMGTHGRTGLGRLLLGSTAERVLRRAEMPVCAVPAEGRQAAMEADEDVEAGDAGDEHTGGGGSP